MMTPLITTVKELIIFHAFNYTPEYIRTSKISDNIGALKILEKFVLNIIS